MRGFMVSSHSQCILATEHHEQCITQSYKHTDIQTYMHACKTLPMALSCSEQLADWYCVVLQASIAIGAQKQGEASRLPP